MRPARRSQRIAPLWVRQTNAWTAWVLTLVAIVMGVVLLDRLLHHSDHLSNVLLVAVVVGVGGATALVRPLNQQPFMVHALDDGDFYETLLVSAVVTLLGVRALLALSGFPQVGGTGLHIAHTLWGGLLMILAFAINFSYLGRQTQWIVAVLAGAGFGLFADELGKFLTTNNNYFYQPALAILYAVFVGLYLIFRFLEREPELTDREYLINGLYWLQEAIIRDLDQAALDRARMYLAHDRSNSRLTHDIQALAAALQGTPPPPPNLLERLRRWRRRLYARLIRTSWYPRAVNAFFLLISALTVGTALLIALSVFGKTSHRTLSLANAGISFMNIAYLLFAGVAGILVVAGVLAFVRSRLDAYRLWKSSMLVSVFLTQVFEFYEIQFLALIGLGLNLIGLVAVNRIMSLERARAVAQSDRLVRAQ